jgi:hypothetical protein
VLGLLATPSQGRSAGDGGLLRVGCRWHICVSTLKRQARFAGMGLLGMPAFVWGSLWPRASGQTWNFQSKRNQALATGTDV